MYGGQLVVAGEAEVGSPWTPAAVQCDSYCQFRIRTFIEPLFVTGDDRQVHPFLGESIAPNADYTQWTIKVRDGITLHRRHAARTPMPSSTTSTARGPACSCRARCATSPRTPTARSWRRRSTTRRSRCRPARTATPTRRSRGRRSRTSSPVQPGFIASPTWLAAVDGNADLATQPVGTGPFMVQEFINGDRMTVVKNPNYWRKDAKGGAAPVPRLDRVPRHRGRPGPRPGVAGRRHRPPGHVRRQRRVEVRRLHRPADAAAGHATPRPTT